MEFGRKWNNPGDVCKVYYNSQHPRWKSKQKKGTSKYGDNRWLQFFFNYSHLTSAVDKQPDPVVSVPESDLIYVARAGWTRRHRRAGPCWSLRRHEANQIISTSCQGLFPLCQTNTRLVGVKHWVRQPPRFKMDVLQTLHIRSWNENMRVAGYSSYFTKGLSLSVLLIAVIYFNILVENVAFCKMDSVSRNPVTSDR